MRKYLNIILLGLLVVIGCEDGAGGEDGLDGMSVMVTVVDEPSGDNCPSGGSKVSFGYDTNENGVLDATEVTTSTFICNGENGETGQDGMTGMSVQVVQVTSDNWLWIDSDNDGNGFIGVHLENDDVTSEVVNEGMIMVEFSHSNTNPDWNPLPIILYDGDNSDVNFIIDMFYSYGVGYCDVFWSSSDDRTANEWLEISSLTDGYLKITTLLPPS